MMLKTPLEKLKAINKAEEIEILLAQSNDPDFAHKQRVDK